MPIPAPQAHVGNKQELNLQRENNLFQMNQQYVNTLNLQRGPSTAEAALARSNMDGTEKYQKISEIGKGKFL